MITFKNLPDTSTPLTAENLNANFDELKGYVLYDNPTGSSSSITLSDSAANYSYLEIFYKGEDIHRSIKVASPNYKTINLQVNVSFGSSNYFKVSKWNISNNSILFQNGNAFSITATGIGNFQENYNQIEITKVIGYK